MNPKFVTSERKNINIRMALCGPTGSGKTFTALGLATTIAAELGGKVAVIDTERSSADRYADKFHFDACQLETFAPEDYMAAINEAADAGYSVLVIDSLSHAWDGQDGLLERVETIAARSKSGSSFNAWSQATPVQRRMIDCILAFPGHVFVTMRSKMEFVQENGDNGKTIIRKVGLAPVQRAGIEYEFDLVGDMDQEHYLVLTKSRAADLADKCFPKPGKKFALDVLAWARGSAEAAPRTETKEPVTPPNPPKEEAKKPAPPKTEKAKRDPAKIPVTECPKCGQGKNPTSHLCTSCDRAEESEARAKNPEKPLRFFVCGACYQVNTVRDLPQKCEKCGKGELIEGKTLKEAQEKGAAMQKEVADRAAAEKAAATPPVSQKAPAEMGADIAAKLTRINDLIKTVTGAKNRMEVLKEVSGLAGRPIDGLAKLAGAEADELISLLEDAEALKDDPASLDAFLSSARDAASQQGVAA